MPLLDAQAGLSCLETIRSPRFIRRIAKVCAAGFLVMVVGIVFLPWQQFVRGTGKVVAYDPLEREVVIEAPLSGRLEKAYVVEGKKVAKGDLLFELEDNDPELLANVQDLLAGAKRRRQAAQLRIDSLQIQLEEQERALPPLIAATKSKETAMSYAAKTAEQQFERVKKLFEDERGLVSRREYELALLARDRSEAEYLNAQAELLRVKPDGNAKLQSIRASLESARSDLVSAEQAERYLIIKVSQTERQAVLAPRDGIVLRIQATEGTYLKEKSPLCTIIPDTDNRMAELYVSGNDMPLLQARLVDEEGNIIRRGSPVRLQFEGWPAVQFMGWPSVARGTFGGEIVLIDPAGNARGDFRILIAPDPELGLPWANDPTLSEDGWPGARWLRQGVRVNGWVWLRRVPLWFEIWRQMNGFPPALSPDEVKSASSKP